MEILLQKEKKASDFRVSFSKVCMDLYLVPFSPTSLLMQPTLSLESMSFCPSEKRQGQRHPTLYLKSCDRVPWMLCLQPDPLPSWFLKTRPSRVSPGYPAPHHHPSQLTLPSFLLQPNMVCDRTITVPPELCLPPWLQSLFKKKKWKSQKSTLLLTGMGMNRVIVQNTVVALALSHRAQSLPRRVSAGEL